MAEANQRLDLLRTGTRDVPAAGGTSDVRREVGESEETEGPVAVEEVGRERLGWLLREMGG